MPRPLPVTVKGLAKQKSKLKGHDYRVGAEFAHHLPQQLVDFVLNISKKKDQETSRASGSSLEFEKERSKIKKANQ